MPFIGRHLRRGLYRMLATQINNIGWHHRTHVTRIWKRLASMAGRVEQQVSKQTMLIPGDNAEITQSPKMALDRAEFSVALIFRDAFRTPQTDIDESQQKRAERAISREAHSSHSFSMSCLTSSATLTITYLPTLCDGM